MRHKGCSGSANLVGVVTVVFHLADAFNFAPAEAFLNGLASVKAKTGQAVHFLHVGVT